MTEPTLEDLDTSLVAQPVPDGFVIKTYWHPDHAHCAITGSADPLTMYVPTDMTGWLGVACGSCGLQLGS